MAEVSYAGLAPGLVGVYQFNIVLPDNLPGGDQPLQISLNGTPVSLQTLFLPVAANGGGGLPPVPTNLTATPGDGSAGIAFRTPPPNGGQPLTSYTATSTAGGAATNAAGTASPIVVS